jgi:hypothetical protein
MSPVEELSQAARRILTAADAEIAKIQTWIQEETEEDLRAGHSEELKRLRRERREVAQIIDNAATTARRTLWS